MGTGILYMGGHWELVEEGPCMLLMDNFFFDRQVRKNVFQTIEESLEKW